VFEDASHFEEAALGVVDIANTEGDGDNVKGVVRVGESRCICHFKVDIQACFCGFGGGQVEHIRAEVRACDMALWAHGAFEGEGQVSCSGCAVQHFVAGGGACEFDGFFAPIAVCSQREDVVGEIIAWGNLRKHAADGFTQAWLLEAKRV